MAIYDFKLRTVSPAFIAGMDKNKPEMRAASIRGQLRYWLRAIVGASTDSLEEVWRRESAVFGSTKNGSAVSVRVYRDKPAKSGKYSMLPHRTNERERSFQTALSPGQVYDLQLVTRPGVLLSADALDSVALWSLLGGIGRRSRRMFGSIQVTTSENIDRWYRQPQTADDLATIIHQVLSRLSSSPYSDIHSGIPHFPTLHPSHSWVIVGRKGFDAQDEREKAVKALFDLIHSDYLNIRMLGFAGISQRDKDYLRQLRGRQKKEFEDQLVKRRASPLVAQLRRINGELYPVLTLFRAEPEQVDSQSNIDWSILKRFMEDTERRFQAERVWGGW